MKKNSNMNNNNVNGNYSSVSNFFGAHALAEISKQVQEKENIIEEEKQKMLQQNGLIAKTAAEVEILVSQNGQPVSEEDSDEAAIEELVTLLEKTIPEAQESLSYIAKKAQEIRDDLQKAALINQTTPKQKFAKATSLQKHSLTEKDRCRFFEIEEAMSNTFIFSVGPLHVIEYQLGVLAEAKNKNLISKELFDFLTGIRKEYTPDKCKFSLVNGRLLVADMNSICQYYNDSLAEDAEYQACKDKFIQRLNGIDYELIKGQMDGDELRKELGQGNNVTLENLPGTMDTISLPSLPEDEIRRERLKVCKLPGLIFLFEKIKAQAGPKPLAEGIGYQELVEYEKARDRSVLSIILSGIEEKLKHQYLPDGGRILFEKIMQETVKLRRLISEDEKSRQGLKFIADIESGLGKAKIRQHETMKAGISFHSCATDELAMTVTLALKTYNEKSESISSPLKSHELKAVYLQDLKQVNLGKLIVQLVENNCISKGKEDEYYYKLRNDLKNETLPEQEKQLDKFISNAKNKKSAQKCFKDFKDRHRIIEGIEQAIENFDPASIQVYQHHFLFPSVPESSCEKVVAPRMSNTALFSNQNQRDRGTNASSYNTSQKLGP